MFNFSFDDNATVTFPGYDTPVPTVGGFDTSTLPDFNAISSFNDNFQSVINQHMPEFTFAFDPAYSQIQALEPIRNIVPSILAQQDQIKAISNDLVSKVPALQQQFDGYKGAYSDYETKLNNYNNFEAFAKSLGAQARDPMGVKYYPNSVSGPVIVGPQIKSRGSYYPSWEIYKNGTTNTQGRWVATNYADVVRDSTNNMKSYQDAYTNAYTTYQNEVKTLQDNVNSYKTSVEDFQNKTKSIIEEEQKRVQQQKEQEDLARKQEEERKTAATKAEQERIAQQQEQERLALEAKQKEEATQLEIKRQAEEKETARIKAEDDVRLKTEEDARIKAEDDARLKQIMDELEKKKTIDTPPTLVSDLDKSKVTIENPTITDTDPSTTPPTEPPLPPPVSPEPPDLDPTELDPTKTPTDTDIIDLIFPKVDPTQPIKPVSPVSPVTDPTKPVTDPTKPITTPVTDPTAPIKPVTTPVTPDPTVEPITVTPPPVTPVTPDPTIPTAEPLEPITVNPPPDIIDEPVVDPVEEPIIDPIEEPIDEPKKPKPKPKDTDNVNLTILDIPNRKNLPSTRRNTALASSLNLNTNVGSLLGTGLSTRPDVSTTSDPYLLGTDDKRKNVWNTESLRGALGI
jgi:hypothetical protein